MEEEETSEYLCEDGGSLMHRDSRTEYVHMASVFDSVSTIGESLSDASLRTVVIEGVQESYEELLKDRLENRSKGGGRMDFFQRDESSSKNVIVRFAHQKVADNMLRQGTITILHETMKIRQLQVKESNSFNDRRESFRLENASRHGDPHSTSASGVFFAYRSVDSTQSFTSFSDISTRTIIVEDVPEEYKDSLSDCLRNHDKGGGRLESFERDQRNQKNMIAVFARQKAAENMLKQRTVKVFDRIMKVCSTQIGELSSSSDLQQMSNTIKVFNVPANFSKDFLELCFENKRFNGGPISNLQLRPLKKQAIITFRNPQDAEAVAKMKTHKLTGTLMDIVLLEQPSSTCCQGVKVSGINWAKIGQEILVMFFENEHRSGGGDILEIFTDQNEDTAVITYVLPHVAQRVLEKHKQTGHTLDDVPLRVKALVPRSPPPVFFTETEKARLIVKGLPFRITLSKLNKFIEKPAGCQVTGWVLGVKKSTAMLEFNGNPDYKALRDHVSSVPFNGRMIGIQKMPLATCLLVVDLSTSDDDKFISTYFEDKIGASDSVRYERKTADSAVLEFQNHSELTSILSQSHTVNGKTLNLKPYSKELRCVLPEKISEEPLDNWFPQSMKIKCTQKHVHYVQRSPFIKEGLESICKEANCVVTWPSEDGKLEVELKQLTKETEDSDKQWPEKCRRLLESHLEDVVCQKFSMKPDVWERFQSKVTAENLPLVFDFDEKRGIVCIIGFSKQMSSHEEKIKDVMKNIEEQLQEELEMRQRKSETLNTLKSHQLQYIQAGGVISEMESRFQIVIKTDGKAVLLEGKDEDLMEAKLFIYSKLNLIDSKFADLSEAMTELITTEPTKTYINDYFIQNQIKAVFERRHEKTGVTIHGIGDEPEKALEFLKCHFVESQVDLSEVVSHALQSNQWPEFESSLKQIFKFVAFVQKAKTFGIACQRAIHDKLRAKLTEFFDKHDAVDIFISMKSVHVELLAMGQQAELQELEKKLRESAVGGRLKQVLKLGDASGFAVKGNHEEVGAAKKLLETFAKKAIELRWEVARAGVISLMQSSEGKDYLTALQNKHSVVLRTVKSDPVAAQSMSSEVKPGPRYHTEIWKGHEIILTLGDITDIQTNAIVNPTNPCLELCGGLGLEIVEMGGKEIEEECRNHVLTHGQLLPGKVFVSKGKNLLCDAVIHTIEPTAFDESVIKVFQSAIKTSLDEALKHNFETLAFPVHFGYAFKRQILFATLKDFFQNNETAALKRILFCDSDVTLLAQFEKHLKEYEKSLNSGPSPTSAFPANPPVTTQLSLTTPEGVLIKFFSGSICSLEVDAIVNSTAKNLVLASGGISKAILSAAGAEIQKECQMKAPAGLNQFGDVLRTKSYNLQQCKAVYHGAGIQWDNGAGPCEQVLHKFISQALTQAHRDGMTSIAIPAIGSGTLKVPHDTVVALLIEEIMKFSKTYPGTSLKTVYTVAYNLNLPSVAAFEKKFLALQAQFPTSLLKNVPQAETTKILAKYNEMLTIIIHAMSQATVQTIQAEVTKFIDNASDKIEFKLAQPLTEEQLERINFLQRIDSVQAVIRKNVLTVDGLKKDVHCAKEMINFIIKDS